MRNLKGNFTIEAAIVMPLALGMFVVMIFMLFYYHDKNIVTGAAYEIVVVGGNNSELSEEELGVQLQERLDRKLLLFSTIYVDIHMEKSNLVMYCRSSKHGMTLNIRVSMTRTEPEVYIRNIRRLQKLENQIGDLNESIL